MKNHVYKSNLKKKEKHNVKNHMKINSSYKSHLNIKMCALDVKDVHVKVNSFCEENCIKCKNHELKYNQMWK